MAANLKKRGATYYAVLNVPRPHRAAVGRNELVMSLRTSDLRQANAMKWEALRRLQALLEAKVEGSPERLAVIEALAWNSTLQAERGVYDADAPAHVPAETAERVLDAVRTRAEELRDNVGSRTASRFFQTAMGRAVFLRDMLPVFIEEQRHVRQKTRDLHEAAVEELLEWNGKDTTVAEVSRKRAGEFVGHLQKATKLKTVQRKASSLATFWKWMMQRGHINNNPAENPWKGQGLYPKKGRAGKPTRRRWRDEELLVILGPRLVESGRDLKAIFRAALPTAVRLALMTGARIEEICEWKASNIEKDAAGLWINNETGKSEAARRRIPVHPAIVPLVKRLAANPDAHGYLLHNLPRGGPDKVRSHYLSKVFGRQRRKAGLTDEAIVFHSLRNTFMEHMEAADVPITTVKKIVGHERGDLTFGGYSKGELLKLQDAMKKLHYSAEVMREVSAH